MQKHQLNGLFHNCDEKCFPEHKCKEQNLVMAISAYVVDKEVEVPHVVELPSLDDTTPPIDQPEVELLISFHSLTVFSAPQTLKIIGYIKHRKVIIFLYSGNTHNFIDRHIT
jgi:hypothetical protein